MSTQKSRPMRLLPFQLGLSAIAIMAGASGLVRGPLGFLVFLLVLFGLEFGLLVCLRAVVRARTKSAESTEAIPR